MAMVATKTFSGRELEDPKKHVKRFKLNVLAKKLPADQLQARFILIFWRNVDNRS